MSFKESFAQWAVIFTLSGTCSLGLAQELNNLRVTNRAQCALDSERPTESAFLILDGYNAGKLSHSLAKKVGKDGDEMSLQGMQQFRIAVSRLTKIIMNRLMAGELPLLEQSQLAKYKALVAKCSNKTYCAELNSYLMNIWKNSEGQGVPWSRIDNFRGDHFMRMKKKDRVACFYLKNFSALQEHLNTAEVTKENLLSIAQAATEPGRYLEDCESTDPQLNSRNSIIQLDLNVDSTFSKRGFAFWNSLKVYLSFAWRNSDSVIKIAPELGNLFRSIAFEESVMMVPNGCRSIERPECDAETLSINGLRELARSDDSQGNLSRQVPEGAEEALLFGDMRSVNDDLLETRKYDTASEWAEHFRRNYVQTRGSMKNRLHSAVQFLNIVSDSFAAQELTALLQPLVFSDTYSEEHRNELYYMCTEFRLAGDKRIDFMRSDIDRLQQLTTMQKAFEGSKKNLSQLSDYFDQVGKEVLSFCDSLEQEKIWNEKGYVVNKAGLLPWARELLQISFAESISTEARPVSFGPHLLSWDPYKGTDLENAICISAIDCVRRLTKAMVDIYAVAKHAEAFLPVKSTISAPSLFNPYAELKACKIYDPWFQTRRANKRLMVDLLSTAAFGWNPLPIYLDADFKSPRVVSLKQMIENGTLRYDSKIEKEKMEYALMGDFGPLVGAPCALAIAPNSAKNFDFYAFKGISVNYCDVKSSGTTVGTSPGEIENQSPERRSYCGGCSLNFVGVGSGISASTRASFNPLKIGIYFFRAFHRYITAKKDDTNVPRSFEVDIKKVTETYNKYGTIPDFCVAQLAQGYGCYPTLCSAKAADHFERYTGRKVHALDLDQVEDEQRQTGTARSVTIKSALCNGPVRVSFTCNDNGQYFKPYEKFGGLYGLSKSCRRAIGQNFWGF